MCTTGKEVDTFSSGSDPMFCLQGPTRCLWQGTHLLMTRVTSRLPSLAKDSVARLIVQFLNRHAASMWYIIVSTLQLLDVYAARLFGACSRQEGRRAVIFHPL